MTSLRLKRGTTTQLNSYTGPPGELTVDTTSNQLRLHNGTTAGGVIVGGLTVTSVKTSAYNANVNELVRIDSTTGSFTITLPATPSGGDKISFLDITNQCGTNPILVAANGKTILGDSTGISLDANGAVLGLVFNNLTNNWSKTNMFSSSFGIITAPSGSYIATPAATPAIGDYFEGGYYTGMIWNQLVQSSTSMNISTGSKLFTVPDMTNDPIVYVGQQLEVRSRANPANKFVGTVTSAAGTTLTLNVTTIGGSGTFSDWSIMARYRVLVAPKASGENTVIALKSTSSPFPSGCQSLNDGWTATNAMKNADNSTVYPAAHWARGLTINSKNDWYIPARDELELCWRNLKPTTDSNYTGTDRPTGQSFNYMINGAYGDVSNQQGVNNNSSPIGNAYTSGSPSQTTVTAFRTGGSEAFNYGSNYYWSSTEYNTSAAWYQRWGSGGPGVQGNNPKTLTRSVRAVRRSII